MLGYVVDFLNDNQLIYCHLDYSNENIPAIPWANIHDNPSEYFDADIPVKLQSPETLSLSEVLRLAEYLASSTEPFMFRRKAEISGDDEEDETGGKEPEGGSQRAVGGLGSDGGENDDDGGEEPEGDVSGGDGSEGGLGPDGGENDNEGGKEPEGDVSGREDDDPLIGIAMGSAMDVDIMERVAEDTEDGSKVCPIRKFWDPC